MSSAGQDCIYYAAANSDMHGKWFYFPLQAYLVPHKDLQSSRCPRNRSLEIELGGRWCSCERQQCGKAALMPPQGAELQFAWCRRYDKTSSLPNRIEIWGRWSMQVVVEGRYRLRPKLASLWFMRSCNGQFYSLIALHARTPPRF